MYCVWARVLSERRVYFLTVRQQRLCLETVKLKVICCWDVSSAARATAHVCWECTHDDATPVRSGHIPTGQAAQLGARRTPVNPQPAPTESGV